MRIGEPLAIYDSNLTNNTRDRFELFLDSKGYFNASVEYKKKIRHNRITSTFKIEEGPAFKIDTLFLQTGDSAITDLIKKNEKESFLQVDENYEQANLTRERERLDLLRKVQLDVDWSRQYIQWEM